jgi:DNA-directed RNA polymerase subunit RPC12/RpoP
MQSEIPFIARCARCGNAEFDLPDRLMLEADMTCHVCGHEGKLVEFADVTTLDAILQMKRGWRDVLH